MELWNKQKYLKIPEHFLYECAKCIASDHDFRGFSGKVSSGKINVGETIFVGKTTQKAKVESIVLGFSNEKFCQEEILSLCA